MKRLALALAALPILLAACGEAKKAAPAVPQQPSRQETIQLEAADGVTVHGTLTEPPGARALILLFHQAQSGQGEYLRIVPRLTAERFATLTIDQRSGGEMFGGNWTAKGLGKEASYLDARPDLDAALAWAKDKKLPVILWGSSYSASLSLLLAARHPKDVAAVLAFSPGEYFEGKPRIGDAAAKLTMPVFITSAQDPGEIAEAKALIDAVPAKVKRQFVPTQGGVHGSSILNPDRNAKGAEAAWNVVLPFLRGVAP